MPRPPRSETGLSAEFLYHMLHTQLTRAESPFELLQLLAPTSKNIFIPDPHITDVETRLSLPIIYISAEYRDSIKKDPSSENLYPEIHYQHLDDIFTQGSIPPLFNENTKIVESPQLLTQESQLETLRELITKISSFISSIDVQRQKIESAELKSLAKIDSDLKKLLQTVRSTLVFLTSESANSSDDDDDGSNATILAIASMNHPSYRHNQEVERKKHLENMQKFSVEIDTIESELRVLSDKNSTLFNSEIRELRRIFSTIHQVLQPQLEYIIQLLIDHDKRGDSSEFENLQKAVDRIYTQLVSLQLDMDALDRTQEAIKECIQNLSGYLWFETVARVVPIFQKMSYQQLEQQVHKVRKNDNQDLESLFRNSGLSDDDIQEWIRDRKK